MHDKIVDSLRGRVAGAVQDFVFIVLQHSNLIFICVHKVTHNVTVNVNRVYIMNHQ